MKNKIIIISTIFSFCFTNPILNWWNNSDELELFLKDTWKVTKELDSESGNWKSPNVSQYIVINSNTCERYVNNDFVDYNSIDVFLDTHYIDSEYDNFTGWTSSWICQDYSNVYDLGATPEYLEELGLEKFHYKNKTFHCTTPKYEPYYYWVEIIDENNIIMHISGTQKFTRVK